MFEHDLMLSTFLYHISRRISRLEAEVLCAAVLNCSRTDLIIRSGYLLSKYQIFQCLALVKAREQGVPIAYLLNKREFYGMQFFVTPSVLIPRPETEFLVDQAINFLAKRKNTKCIRVLELGTGCGAISIAIKKHFPQVVIVATDISVQALEVAIYNADRLLDFENRQTLFFREGSWYDALLNLQSDHCSVCQAFDLILSNPPYVAFDDPHLKTGGLQFEPMGALTDYNDGLSSIRHIIEHSSKWLLPDGELWLEHGCMHKKSVSDIFSACGFVNIKTVLDFSGLDRITGGCLQAV